MNVQSGTDEIVREVVEALPVTPTPIDDLMIRVAKRRRNRRTMIALSTAAAIALVATSLVFRDLEDRGEVTSPTGSAQRLQIRGTGTLIQADGDARLCVGLVKLSSPPRCELSYLLRGVPNLSELLAAGSQNGPISWVDNLEIVGELEGDSIHVDSAEVIPTTQIPATSELPFATCPDAEAGAYHPVEAAALLQLLSTAYSTTFAGGWEDPRGVLVLRFTDASEAKYAGAIHAGYQGPYCIESGQVAVSELATEANSIIGVALPLGSQVISATPNAVTGSVDISLTLVGAEIEASVRSSVPHAGDITGALTVVGGS